MKPVFSLLAGLLLCVCMHAQDDGTGTTNPGDKPRGNFTDRLAFGGNMGLTFGSYTYVDVNPIVGYRVSDKFIPGIGLSYSYVHIHYNGYPDVRSYFYGGSVFARYYFVPQLFLHAECEEINGEWDPYVQPGERYFLPAYFVGGGYRESIGNLSSYILFLYNLNNKSDSPYDSPLVIRVGFGVGL